MLLSIAIQLLLPSARGFIGFYVVGWWIHLLLIVAPIAFILSFVRGRPAACRRALRGAVSRPRCCA